MDIIALYNNLRNQSIYLFFDAFTKTYCNIMSNIYFDLFKLLNLELIVKLENLEMILKL